MNKVAICISTSFRPKEFEQSCINWVSHSQHIDARVFVVEDGSNYSIADHSFEDKVGVAVVKNKCIELAMDWGADEIVLSDDDTWAISNDWYELYSGVNQNHLMYNFYDKGIVHGSIKSHKKPSGCMMYFKRICFETVGGFDTNYSPYGWEHIDLSRRIYNAGLTPFRFIDAVGSNKVIYSLDEHKLTKSTVDRADKDKFINDTYQYFIKQGRSKEYINYK